MLTEKFSRSRTKRLSLHRWLIQARSDTERLPVRWPKWETLPVITMSMGGMMSMAVDMVDAIINLRNDHGK